MHYNCHVTAKQKNTKTATLEKKTNDFQIQSQKLEISEGMTLDIVKFTEYAGNVLNYAMQC